MWNADKKLTPEEIAVMREFEYLYFKFNPGFRAMWHDNFEGYFKGTLDEKYWKQREREREKELDEIFEENMRDPDFASWQHELAIIEETIMGDPAESPIARSRWYEREQWIAEAQAKQEEFDRKLHNDELYKLAKAWSMEVLKLAGPCTKKRKIQIGSE